MAENDTSMVENGTSDDDASASADAGSAASTTPDEVSVLRSRYAGQTAKVNELTSERARLIAEREALIRERDELRSGKANTDEAAKALLAQKDEEIAAIRREVALARIESKYPETFGELGEAAFGLSEEKLAAMEARLRGASGASEQEPPTPRGQNAARRDGVPAGGREPKEETSADILAALRSAPLPSEWGGGY